MTVPSNVTPTVARQQTVGTNSYPTPPSGPRSAHRRARITRNTVLRNRSRSPATGMVCDVRPRLALLRWPVAALRAQEGKDADAVRGGTSGWETRSGSKRLRQRFSRRQTRRSGQFRKAKCLLNS